MIPPPLDLITRRTKIKFEHEKKNSFERNIRSEIHNDWNLAVFASRGVYSKATFNPLGNISSLWFWELRGYPIGPHDAERRRVGRKITHGSSQNLPEHFTIC